MKLLITIPSPRDIPNFKTAIDTIPCDKVWIKYMRYSQDPYGQLKQFFLEHDEYTHLAICQDDLMPHPQGVQLLLQDLDEVEVISACCNKDKNDFDCPKRDSWTIAATKNMPTLKLPRHYDWFTWGEMKEKGLVIPVLHSGKAFCILPRKIVAHLRLHGDKDYLTRGVPSAYDIGLSHELNYMGVQEYIDTRVFFAHFRYGGKIVRDKEPEIWYDRVGEERQVLKPYEREPFSGQAKYSNSSIMERHSRF